MRIIDPSHSWIQLPTRGTVYSMIAAAMRNCYRAELNAMPATDEEMVEKAIKRGHLSVIEFATASVNIICDRGVSHELVRHRIAGFAQESTRYCNYSGEKFGRELTFIRPSWAHGPNIEDNPFYQDWLAHMFVCEKTYMNMLDHGASPQEARAVLPNSLATKIAVTANMREWGHIFKMRCDMPAHPDMRHSMNPILIDMVAAYPTIFSPTHQWLEKRGAFK